MHSHRIYGLARVQQRLWVIRSVFYALGALVGASLVGLGEPRLAVLAVASAASALAPLCVPRRAWRMEISLWIDVMMAQVLWWLFGPIAGVDFVLFYVVAAAGLVLPTHRAWRTIAAAVVSELGQIPLHFVAKSTPLPLFHEMQQVVSVGEFAASVALRSAALLAFAVLFVTVARILRQANRARAESEQRFRELYERAPVIYLTVDPSGRITRTNRAAQQWFGGTATELVDTPALMHCAPGEHGQGRAMEIFNKVLSGIPVRSAEVELRPEMGHDRWVSVNADPVLDDSGTVIEIRAALMDITDQRRAQRLQKEARAQLEELVAAKDRFLASVSHELRTPLAAVLGFSETLRTEWDLLGEADRREFMALIAGQSRELSFLVEDLLVAGRAELNELTIRRGPVNLAAELDTVVTLCGLNDADLDRRVDRQIHGTLQLALADAARVRQILRNLVTNALRHGGDRIRFVGLTKNHSVVLQVRDNGPGVPDKLRDSLFQPYVVAHHVRGTPESVGLGLSVASALSRLMGGELRYWRQAGESVFELRLPSSDAHVPAAEIPGALA